MGSVRGKEDACLRARLPDSPRVCSRGHRPHPTTPRLLPALHTAPPLNDRLPGPSTALLLRPSHFRPPSRPLHGAGAPGLPAVHCGAVTSGKSVPPRTRGEAEQARQQRRHAPGLLMVCAPGEPRPLREARQPPARAAGQVRPIGAGSRDRRVPRVCECPTPISFPVRRPWFLWAQVCPRRPSSGGQSLPETPTLLEVSRWKMRPRH